MKKNIKTNLNQDLPLVSFCLFTYNQENYIEEALKGALSQDYGNLEIIVSDDSSSDSTWCVIEKCCADYNGEHKLVLNRNSQNLGVAAHVNKLYHELSKGEYVALAAGDDISLPHRISHSVDFLEKRPDVVALSAGIVKIDSKSRILVKQPKQQKESQVYGLDYYLSRSYQHINGPSRIVKRSLIEAYPPLNDSCPTEDTTTLLRAFLYGKVGLLNETLIMYRRHDSNISSPVNIRKMRVEHIFEQYFKDVSYAQDQLFIDEDVCKKVLLRLSILRQERLFSKHRFRAFNKIINLIRQRLGIYVVSWLWYMVF